MLKINNLTIKYKRTILDDVSVSFPRGAVTVIRGASGSGKSSLLNVLGLIKKPNKECTYSLGDEDVDFNDEGKKSDFRLRKIGFVLQEKNLIQELTAIENIMVPIRMLSKDQSAAREKAQELVEYTGLGNVANNYPSSLSGGEEQRVAIARALVNDADIILADEPTAALDAGNSEIVLQLFKKLAHELNKIVIIVSHDDKVPKIADIVYEIKDYKLVMTYGLSGLPKEKVENLKTTGRKKIFNFINYYIRKRNKEKKLNRAVVLITAVIAAFAALFVNFGESYGSQQKDFINAISEKNLFIINDTMEKYVEEDYEDALGLSDEDIEKVKAIPQVFKAYPYYEFTSSGFTEQKDDRAEISILDGGQTIKKITYKNTLSYTREEPQFRIVPIYQEQEQEIENFLKYTGKTGKLGYGAVLTMALAKSLSDNPESLVGKTMEIKCFVPTKLYDTAGTILEGIENQVPGRSEMTDEEGAVQYKERIVKTDRPVYKLVTIKKVIDGILPDLYLYEKSEEDDNLIFLSYIEIDSILNTNKDTDYKKTSEGFTEKEFGPSALNVYVDSFESIPGVKSKIEKISPTMLAVGKIADIRLTQNYLNTIKNTMRAVSIILIIIVMVMFYFAFYFKSRTRKREIGILKAIGMTTRDVVSLVGIETLITALNTFIFALIVAVLIMLLCNAVLTFKNLFIISFESVAFLFFLSFFIVIASSIASIWRTSRIDIIDAIRNNK